MSLSPLLKLKGSKALLHLIDPVLNGDTLTAQGYIWPEVKPNPEYEPGNGKSEMIPAPLKKGRVFRHDGQRYVVPETLPGGTHVVPITRSEPVVLLRRT